MRRTPCGPAGTDRQTTSSLGTRESGTRAPSPEVKLLSTLQTEWQRTAHFTVPHADRGLEGLTLTLACSRQYRLS